MYYGSGTVTHILQANDVTRGRRANRQPADGHIKNPTPAIDAAIEIEEHPCKISPPSSLKQRSYRHLWRALLQHQQHQDE